MQLSDDAIREYQELYKQDFGEEISFEEAREIATRLVTLYVLLRQRLPNERGYGP